MSRKISLVFILPIVLFCTSCFEIVEQVSVKDGGKGSYKIIANMSQSKANIDGLLDNDSIMGRRVPKIQEITSEMEKAKNTLASMPGISNVTLSKDFTNYIFNLSCDFTSVKALDQALVNTVNKLSKGKTNQSAGNYTYSNKTFKRQIVYDYSTDAKRSMTTQIQGIMEKASFMGIYRFPSKIKSVSNSKAKISPSGKASMLKISLIELLKSRYAINNTIVLE